MAVSATVAKPAIPLFSDEIVYLRSLAIRRAVVSSAKPCVPGPRPRLTYSFREILRVASHVEGCRCVSPDLPYGLCVLEPLKEPRLLFRSENRLRRRSYRSWEFPRCVDERIVAGGLPPLYARAASRISIALAEASLGNRPLASGLASSYRSVLPTVAALVGDDHSTFLPTILHDNP